jgi:biotin synthase
MTNYELIFSLGKKVLAGGQITCEEALALTAIDEIDIPILLGIANKVRERFTGSCVDTCQIVNARSGGCSEDCKFCAQSAHHAATIATYPLLSEEELLKAAQKAQADKAYRFCIVTSGCGMEGDRDFEKITSAIRRIGRETKLERCCSLGILQKEHVSALKEAGITRYHHNLEASESFFGKICTTHTYQSRVATIKNAKEAGLEVCSGGIIGMGETWRQRVELAFALKELNVDSIPINVLNPIKGTAFADCKKLNPLEILQTFAIFRLVLPSKIIRYAGGREQNLGELVPLGFLSGINGMLLGNYLTTQGRGACQDLQTVTSLGLSYHHS